MELKDALSQIKEIHHHINRSHVYKGYRSFPVFLTGLTAILSGIFQSFFVQNHALSFVLYWTAIAATCFFAVSIEMLIHYFTKMDAHTKQQTKSAISQIFPSLLFGAVLTLFITTMRPHDMILLPGIWCGLFSLGLFASRPYLPRITGWIGLFYFISGCIYLTALPANFTNAGIFMACIFGIGQVSNSLMLYWNIERKQNVTQR